MNSILDELTDLADACNGKLENITDLGNGVGSATLSMELSKDHWLYEKSVTGFNAPPMPLRMPPSAEISIDIWDAPDSSEGRRIKLSRQEFEKAIIAAGRYAVKCATMDGTEEDFSPDAMVRNLCVGFLGYYTEDALSSDDWANPKEPFDFSVTDNIDNTANTSGVCASGII